MSTIIRSALIAVAVLTGASAAANAASYHPYTADRSHGYGSDYTYNLQSGGFWDEQRQWGH